mmetsp:Transcript_130232/g.309007  ORF Transcript_130232/g.309007 Transcript_130232/m.309007 type:complete len:706 (-) Transcript_130232:33-2150(-)
MGKNQHSKDMLHLRPTEWAQDGRGFKAAKWTPFSKLPLNCCFLSLQPFDRPVGTRDGSVFEIAHILKYIKKYGQHPVHGGKLEVKDLVPLHFHRNAQGDLHCPVTFKVLGNNTAVCANLSSGHVYCMEAVLELNKKNKNWKDLMTSQPFKWTDIVLLQDPDQLDGREVSKFHFMVMGQQDEVVREITNPESKVNDNKEDKLRPNAAVERIFAEKERLAEKKVQEAAEKAAADPEAAAAEEAKAKAAAAKAAARTGRAAAKSAARAESPRGAKRKASDASIGKPARGSSPKARGKGGKEVDKHVPGAGGFKVYEDYSVKLNQTNIAGNNNKYYVIQVLVGGGQYHAWNRWGRVGESGATKLKTFGTPEAAIKDFKSKFREKSANAWEYIDDFKPKKGKYIIVETEEGGGGGDAPMGKLTEKQIVKGQGVLDKIEAALKKKGKSALDDLSSEYFSLIPHDFGRKRPTSINTVDLLQQQQELLKFYLRMGFEEVESKHMSPVEGVLELPVPASLDDAAGSVAKSHQIKESATFGAKLAKKQAGKPKRKMTDKEYGAILLYTSNAIYKDLNQTLRDNNRGKLKKYFKYLRLFFESMDALPKQKRKLWRGLQVDLHKSPQYKVGSTVVWWGISSCTSDQGVAKGFAQGCGGECTLITVESKTAADISQVTFYSNEKESLLSPGTEFKVKSNKMNGKVCEITLEEMGRQLN